MLPEFNVAHSLYSTGNIYDTVSEIHKVGDQIGFIDSLYITFMSTLSLNKINEVFMVVLVVK